MMTEAIRVHLMNLGIEGAENWTHEQITEHVDSTLLRCTEENPETFGDIVDEFWDCVKANMLTLNDVLSEESLQS